MQIYTISPVLSNRAATIKGNPGETKHNIKAARETPLSNGAAKTTETKKAKAAKRMRRAGTEVRTPKTKALRAAEAKEVEVKAPKIDVRKLPKARG